MRELLLPLGSVSKLVIVYPVVVKYLRKNRNTMRQYISYL